MIEPVILKAIEPLKLIKDEQKKIVGVATKSRGINKKGEKKPTFEEGVEIRAKATVLAEGARGNIKSPYVYRIINL